MNFHKSLLTLSLLIGLQFLIGCNTTSTAQLETPRGVEWGVPSDCHAGHAESHGQVVNGLVQAKNCHASHFDGNPNRRVILPEGQLPSVQDYNLLISKR